MKYWFNPNRRSKILLSQSVAERDVAKYLLHVQQHIYYTSFWEQNICKSHSRCLSLSLLILSMKRFTSKNLSPWFQTDKGLKTYFLRNTLFIKTTYIFHALIFISHILSSLRFGDFESQHNKQASPSIHRAVGFVFFFLIN